MPRRLVTVRLVASKTPIPRSERLEAVTVDGWKCVTTINSFQVGDLAVFFEIDSFLPASDPRWAFLQNNFRDHETGRGVRLKTTKLCGVLSQGLVLPMSKFPEIMGVFQHLQETEGSRKAAVEKLLDMSFEDVLGIVKYEPSAKEQQTAIALGPFPAFIPRTDQERVQNLPGLFDEHADTVFQLSTKMDGSSMTAFFIRSDSAIFGRLNPLNDTGGRTGDMKSGRFGLCSRNIELVERSQATTGTWFWEVALANDLPNKLEKMGRNLAVQGEVCGSSIQKNFEGFPKGFHDFFVFGAWDIDQQRRLTPRETETLAQELGLKHVPITGYFKLQEIGTSVEALLDAADGVGMNGKKREGIVFKEAEGDFSFKVISNSYLLKHGE